jgi:hypothetical protein
MRPINRGGVHLTMYDESYEHYAESLCHIQFLRDFVIRTSLTPHQFENEFSWPYGKDWNYGYSDDLYEGQFLSMLSVLDPKLTGSVNVVTTDDTEEWANIVHFDSGDHIDPDVAGLMYEAAWAVTFIGNEHDLTKWRHFIQWMKPKAILARDERMEQCHFIWLLDELDGSTILDAWETILSAWEVMEFYDHCADADSWRALRGGNCIPNESDPATAA